jgi:hypothetical protein
MGRKSQRKRSSPKRKSARIKAAVEKAVVAQAQVEPAEKPNANDQTSDNEEMEDIDVVAKQVIKNHLPGAPSNDIQAIQDYCAKEAISNTRQWNEFVSNLKIMSPDGQVIFLNDMNITARTKAAFMAQLKPDEEASSKEQGKKSTRSNGLYVSSAQGENDDDVSFDIDPGMDYPDKPDISASHSPPLYQLHSSTDPELEDNDAEAEEQLYFHGGILRTASTDEEYYPVPDSFEVNPALFNYKFASALQSKAKEIKRHAAMLFGKRCKIPKLYFVKREIVGAIRVLCDTQEKLKFLLAEDIIDYPRRSAALLANPLNSSEWKQLKERYNLIKRANKEKRTGSARCARCGGHGHFTNDCFVKHTPRVIQWDNEHRPRGYQQHRAYQHQQPSQHQQFFPSGQPGYAGRRGIESYDRNKSK